MRFLFFIILLVLLQKVFAQSEFEDAGKLFENYHQSFTSGDFKKAIYYLKEIQRYKDILPPYNIALVYKNLGLMYWNTGNYNLSKTNYELALGITLDNSVKSKYLLSSIYNDFGILQKQIGEYYLALDYYQQARGIMEDLDPDEPRYKDQLSMILLNRAIALIELEKYVEAIGCLLESVEIKTANHLRYIGSAYFNLARCYQESSDFPMAEDCYRQSIEQWIAEYDSTYYELANVYLNFGRLYLDQGDNITGLGFYSKAVSGFPVFK